MTNDRVDRADSPRRAAAAPAAAWTYGVVALLMLVPVTLPVTVLRELVHDRFAVSELATSFFMSINMIAAVLVAPLIGAFSDSWGRRRVLLLVAMALDALLFECMTWSSDFTFFMALRFLEGAAHITAISMLLAAASDERARTGDGRVMAFVGAGLTLGVAVGAPLGGMIGKHSAVAPLHVGAALTLLTAGLAVLVIRDGPRRAERHSILTVLRSLVRDRVLLIPLGFAFIDRFTVGFFSSTFSLFMRRVHDLPSQRIGLLLALFLVPFGLLAYPFGRLSERGSRVWLTCGGSVLYGVGAMFVGSCSVENLPYLMLFLGVSASVMFVPSLLLTTELGDREARAAVAGAFNAVGSLGFIFGPLTGALVSERLARRLEWSPHEGYAAAFIVAGASEVLWVLVSLPFLLRLVREGRTR